MSSFGLYLASVSTPIAQRVLTGLGFGIVTYTGLSVVFSEIQTGIVGMWAVIPPAPAALLGLSGANTAVGILLGALSTRFTMLQLKKLSLIQ